MRRLSRSYSTIGVSRGANMSRVVSPLGRLGRVDSRAFLRTAGMAGIATLADRRTDASPAMVDLWHDADAILRRIVPPQFPARTFDIAAHGGSGDGAFDC